MKLKSVKLLLCGLLTTMLLIRNFQDSQFVMSFFFAVVTWQCYRAAFEAKGFENEQERQAAYKAAVQSFYGTLAGIAWALPYGVLILCAVIGVAKPALQMPMVGLFVAAVVAHSICEMIVWKKAAQKK